MNRTFHFTGALLAAALLAAPVLAGESAVLQNGLSLHVDRHEARGDRVLLLSADGGTIELPAASIVAFEPDEPISPVPAIAAPQLVAGPPSAPGLAAVPAKLAAAPPPQAASPQQLAALAAHKFALPESFVRSVMRAESGFQPAALSPKGAVGLMQLMPGTAQALGVDRQDPRQNAEGGARYLRDLLKKYEDHPDQVLLALAAYNAGPEAVRKYGGVPPFRETRQYILRVLKNWDQHEAAQPPAGN